MWQRWLAASHGSTHGPTDFRDRWWFNKYVHLSSHFRHRIEHNHNAEWFGLLGNSFNWINWNIIINDFNLIFWQIWCKWKSQIKDGKEFNILAITSLLFWLTSTILQEVFRSASKNRSALYVCSWLFLVGAHISVPMWHRLWQKQGNRTIRVLGSRVASIDDIFGVVLSRQVQ